MIIAYTGLPGGGKSLSAIPDFILPALSEGRPVFSNIYGLSPMAIAARLGVNTPRVNRLLRRFSMSFRADVSPFAWASASELPDGSLLCSRADGFEMAFPDDASAREYVFARPLEDGSTHYSNAEGLSLFLKSVCSCAGDPLIVFDECHEYFNPRNFAQLEPFLKYLSEARHDCHDVLLITQHVKDIWEPLLNRVHQTDVFERGRLGFRGQYFHRRFAGCNVLAKPVAVSSRRNDRGIYGLYSSHRKKGAKERLGYGTSIFKNRKLLAMALLGLWLLCSGFFSFLSGGGFFGAAGKKDPAPPAAGSPAPEYNSGGNAIYVKYVVCGALDCKAARPDGSTITLPLDYASGKYPFEVKRYAPSPASLAPSSPFARPK